MQRNLSMPDPNITIDEKGRRILLQNLGKSIRNQRIRAGLSQEGLAHSAYLDRSYMGGVERGERNIAWINLVKIARALKISVSQLISEADL